MCTLTVNAVFQFKYRCTCVAAKKIVRSRTKSLDHDPLCLHHAYFALYFHRRHTIILTTPTLQRYVTCRNAVQHSTRTARHGTAQQHAETVQTDSTTIAPNPSVYTTHCQYTLSLSLARSRSLPPPLSLSLLLPRVLGACVCVCERAVDE